MAESITLAPPRKTFSVEALLDGRIDVLSLLHYLHEKQATGVRDLLVNMLYDLQPQEIDAILPQLVHLWVQWEETQAGCLGDFFLVECARSQLFTLKIMWMLQAEEAHAPPGSRQLPRISEMLKQAEMAHVNAEILTGGGKNGRPVGGRGAAGRQTPGGSTLKRSATQELRQALRSSINPGLGITSPPARSQSNVTMSPHNPHARTQQRSQAQTQQQQQYQQQRFSPGSNPARGVYPMLATLPTPLVQLVHVSIDPAEISAPIDAVVTVHIRPSTMRISNPGLSAPPSQGRSGVSPRSPAMQGRPGSGQRRSPMMDGPAAAFTQSMSASPPAPRWSGSHQYALSSSPPAMSSKTSYSVNLPTRRISHEGIDPLQRMAQAHYAYPQPQQQQARRGAAPMPIARSRAFSPAQMHSPTSASTGTTPPFISSPPVAAPRASATPVRSESPPALDVDWPAPDQDIPPSSSAPAHSPVQSSVHVSSPAAKGGRGGPAGKYATMGPPRRAGTGRDLMSPGGVASPSASKDGNGMDEPTLFHLLSKQVRSEYFNLELLLFNTLHDLSMALAKVPVHDRNRVLREQLRSIDDTIIRGLYFPLLPHSSVNHQHYRILRLLPDDCWTLASRDKAPFLLHLEIAYTQADEQRGAVSIYDSDTYTSFKSNEEIMREAMAMAGITQQAGTATGAAAGNSTPGHPATPLTPSTGEATAAALVTAAQIAHLKDSPNVRTPVPGSGAAGAAAPSPQPQGRQPNVQANGLNIVSDSSAGATEASPEAVPGAHSIPALDNEGKPLTRSRSSTEVRDLEEDDSTCVCAPPEERGRAATTVNASHLSAAGQHPEHAGSSGSGSSSGVSRAKSPLPSAHAASYPTLPSDPPQTPQPQRTVPQPNPFRPRRAAAYQTGPTLCDTDLETLDKAFGESFLAKKARVYASSPFASQHSKAAWDVISVIFKGGDDLRQEVLAMQFITAFERIFRQARLPLRLKTYAVVCTSADSGLIETIPDAVSIDSLKKRIGYANWTCLADFFAAYFGAAELAHIIDGPEEFARKYPFGLVTYQTALRNFVESFAAYSILLWLLQIKDRHNGNIMISREGSIIHIDFGFMLSNSPGGNWNFEQAPFKLTSEYIDVMGGVNSDLFSYFRMLVTRGFLEARAHIDEFIVLCAVHQHTSRMPCFSGPTGATAIDAMRDRFAMHLQSESEVEKFVDQLIDNSIDNWRTRKYDRYQKLVSGIL